MRRPKRPKGEKYRGLSFRGDVIYFEREVQGERRVRVSTGCSSYAEAAAFRDEWLRRNRRRVVSSLDVPTFAEMAARYLAEDTAHLAASTLRSHRDLLRGPGGAGELPAAPLIADFGALKLDQITVASLTRYWATRIEGPGLAIQTGRHHLNVLASVLNYAVDLDLLDTNPVDLFRVKIRRKMQSKRGRAATSSKIRPIPPTDLCRILDAAAEESPRAHLFVLTLADTGLRVGEAVALTWGQVRWGESEQDRTRSLHINRNRPGHTKEVALPKSGRAREVGLSQRLRGALRAAQGQVFRPGPSVEVFPRLDADNFRAREWRRICERAGSGHYALKDLRDSYASHLLTAGVQLAYISKQLGHADVGTTARHYATWSAESEYRDPMPLAPGEIPADLLDRILSPQLPLTGTDQEPPPGLTGDLTMRIGRDFPGSGGQT